MSLEEELQKEIVRAMVESTNYNVREISSETGINENKVKGILPQIGYMTHMQAATELNFLNSYGFGRVSELGYLISKNWRLFFEDHRGFLDSIHQRIIPISWLPKLKKIIEKSQATCHKGHLTIRESAEELEITEEIFLELYLEYYNIIKPKIKTLVAPERIRCISVSRLHEMEAMINDGVIGEWLE